MKLFDRAFQWSPAIVFERLLLMGVFLLLTADATGQSTIPGAVLGHSHPETDIYLGSPSIVLLPDGTYVASHDEFGAKLRDAGKKNMTYVYVSRDRGNTWEEISTIYALTWANLFVYQGDLYIMGATHAYGDLVIRKSKDQGRTWTEPIDADHGLLRNDEEYHTAPMPMVIHNGRIFRAIEDRNPREKWGVNFRAMVISAPLGADLLRASSWTVSNRLRYDQDWPGNAWLEGNMVVTPQGKLVNILRNNYLPEGGRACVTEVSQYGETINFDPEGGFIDFPGGCKKFTIRYDGVSGRYWSLSNYIPDEFKGGNPERTRNTLALISSADLRNWEVNRIVLQHPDVAHVGFQYADWQFEGADLVALIRTAFPEPDGTPAHNCHDANHIIFYRVENFRHSLDNKR